MIPAPRNFFLGLVAGVLGGGIVSAFLSGLAWVAAKQAAEPGLLFFLPVAGLLVGGLYDRFGERATGGTNLILEEIQEPRARTAGRTTPLIFFTSLVSHLFGASVGREGVAVQMSASLADQLSRFVSLTDSDRRVLLQAGAAAGFAAALGTPIAGAVFGLEVLTRETRFRLDRAVELFIAAYAAVGVTRLLGVSHTVFGALPELPYFSGRLLVAALAFGLLAGLLVRVFLALTETLAHLAPLFSARFAVRAFAGGGAIVLLAALFGNRASVGLGIPTIQAAFLAPSPIPLAFEKLVLTAVSVASGFRGGEFIPLVFIGATAASAIAPLFSVSTAFAAACGVSASFGSAARVPLALSLFAAEHFSPAFFLYALAANGAARLAVGAEATLYSSQKTRV